MNSTLKFKVECDKHFWYFGTYLEAQEFSRAIYSACMNLELSEVREDWNNGILLSRKEVLLGRKDENEKRSS